MAAKGKASAKPVGRPSRYKEEFNDQARKLCRLGATDDQIAWFFGVSLCELAMWAWERKEFFDAITPSSSQSAAWAAQDKLYSEKRSAAKKLRMARNPSERIANSARARMWAALKGQSGPKLRRLDYSVEDLRVHLEARFQPGMSWENYGTWHVDHIRPCSSFDLTDEREFAQCWSLSNLQPLWASDNVRKGAKYDGS